MTKKILLSVFFFALIISLSGCRIPLINKEINLPFFGKKQEAVVAEPQAEIKKEIPAEPIKTEKEKIATTTAESNYTDILRQVSEKMSSVQSMSFASSATVSIKVKDRLYSLINNLKNSLKQGSEKKYNISSSKNIAKGPLDFLKDSETVFKFNADFTGKKNKNDFEGKINLSINVEDDSLKISPELKKIGDNAYLKIGEIPGPFEADFNESLGGMNTKWVRFSQQEIENQQKTMENILKDEDAEQIMAIVDPEKNIKNMAEMQKKLAEMTKLEKLFKVTEKLADEKIDNYDTAHYKMSLNKDNLKNIIAELFNAQKEAGKDYPEEFNYVISQYNKLFEQIPNAITKYDGDIWIDNKDGYLIKSEYNITIDLSKIVMEERSYGYNPFEKIVLNINASEKYSNFNEPVIIEAPKDIITFSEFFEKTVVAPMNEAKIKAERARDISNIKQIQTALELYYNDANKYPDKIKFGGKLSSIVKYGNPPKDQEIVIMSKIPQSTKPAKGVCIKNFEYSYASKNKGAAYELKYCLSDAWNDIPAGINTATPEGLYNTKSDSDKDGLTDETETKTYKTNPKKADTDGDGYKDYDEIKNGFNPNGKGKLNLK